MKDFERAGDRLGQAICLAFLGTQDDPALEFKMAVSHYERSLALLDEVHHTFAAAAVARMLGTVLHANGQLDRAELVLKEGLHSLEKFASSDQIIPVAEYWIFSLMLGLPFELSELSDPFSDATREILIQMAEGSLRMSLGAVLSWRNRLDEAGAELERALEISRSNQGQETRMVLTLLAFLRQKQGRYEEARKRFEEVLMELKLRPAAQSGDRIRRERINLYEHLEGLDVAQNQQGEVLVRNSHALEVARSSGDRLAEAMLLKTRAHLLRVTGRDFQAATSLLEEAWSIALELQDPYLETRILVERATCAVASGSFELSATYLEEAITRLRKLGEPRTEVLTWALLASSYNSLGAHDRAQRALREAMDLVHRMHLPEGRAVAQFVEAMPRSQQEDLDLLPVLEALSAAESLLQNPRTVVPRQPSISLQALIHAGQLIQQEAAPDEIVSTIVPGLQKAQEMGEIRHELILRVLLGSAYRKQDQLRLAWREWRAALRIVRRLDFRHQEASLLSGLADLAWIDGRPTAAVRFALDGVTALETTVDDVRVDDLLISLISSNMKIYDRAIVALIKTDRTDQAFEYSERARSRSLLRLLGNQELRATGNADPVLATEMTSLRSQMAELERNLTDPRNEETEQVRTELKSAWRRYEDLLVRIKLEAPRLAELVSPDPVDLGTVQTGILGADTTLISFYLLLDRVVAWVIDREGYVFIPTEMTHADLGDVNCLTSGVVGQARRRGVKPLARCEEGGDPSTAIYEKLLAPLMPHVRHRKLVLVPHDVLHYLPFAALRNPGTGHFLIQDYTLSYTPSVSVLRLLRQETGSIDDGGALVLGNPLTDQGLPELAGARQEAQTVAGLFRVDALLGGDATESRVRTAAHFDVLHVAAHGIYRPENPRFSYLALAAGGDHDGRLEMHEIFEELDLQGVELVVLSACETALGERTGGDDVVGLIRAFLYAGSPAVMATLWSIHDEGSAVLMEGFYRRLLDGQPASEALRQAQLEMLGREEYKSPYYWAGFTLVGEAQRGESRR